MFKRRKGNGCQGKTKDGKPCGAHAMANGLCFFHGNPNKASELGRKGGRNKRWTMVGDADPLPVLNSVTAVRDFVARLTEDVYTGNKSASVARGLAPLLHLQLRVLQVTDIEERLAKLEHGGNQLDNGAAEEGAKKVEQEDDPDDD